jgi:dephospho-CoA kinase
VYTVVLTGGIASGKSTVERGFAARGVDIIDADLVAREVVAIGTPGLAEIMQAFGPAMLDGKGALDRKAMRDRVFEDTDARRRLEAIIHPRVRRTMRERAGAASSAYVLLVIPLFVESGDYAWVDRVLVVDVPRDVQVARLLARDDITLVQAESMLDVQATREQRLAVADDVIDNRGSLADLDAAVAVLHERYLELAAA